MKTINITSIFTIHLICCICYGYTQEIAVLKYKGGGDWYSNASSITNLVKYANEFSGTKIKLPYHIVEAESSQIFKYPIVFMTGHGNISFNKTAVDNLRKYLLSGGFIHIDDNYGMKPYVLKELKKVFPKKEIKLISNDSPIFKEPFYFEKGLPKIHQHDGKPPTAMGYFDDYGRLMVLFTYETDLSDGWEDPQIHNDPQEIREKALKMGVNILHYTFKN